MKIEIRGLEAAACNLVFVLDRLITDERGFRLIYPGEGAHIHRPEPVPKTGAVPVVIRPIGWPKEALIEAQFMNTITGWQFCAHGRITAPHLKSVCDGITFSPTKNGLGIKLEIPDEERHTVVATNIERIIRVIRKSLV